MTCPLCDAELDRSTLLEAEAGGRSLRGFRCPRDHGTFLPADLYFAWREHYEPADPPAEAVPSSDEVGDVKRAKLCPQDQHIMSRYRVRPEGGFWLDRCATCGGVWFDGEEWDATVEAGLLNRLPALLTDAWQRQADREVAHDGYEDRLRDRLGEDLDRVDGFRAWAWQHPQRHLIFSRLRERPDEPQETAD
ncbi:zf-TFIIB domain-containing protein [Rubrivirga marina]|uniref:Transcription factor zinc-finger domain-containing protein n=1 Tax=Rubrivirga marina TaxID=1196024 RepID=A0A271IWJ7_9BACT|nr:zf-TFIIB domain-containing protein [Rubrivirga marina]PAP75500.1 hypothetical protein BSZ37_03085 [Rubrivirga marina]